jgi:hypothetical protein
LAVWLPPLPLHTFLWEGVQPNLKIICNFFAPCSSVANVCVFRQSGFLLKELCVPLESEKASYFLCAAPAAFSNK